MQTATWKPRSQGTAVPAATPEHPGLTTLTTLGRRFQTFDASGVAASPLMVTVATSSYFALYVETQTNRGRRQIKFVPGGGAPEVRFEYRIQAGLGPNARDGSRHRHSLDLAAVANQVEPGLIIAEVTKVFVRVAGSVAIELVLSVESDDPPPPVVPPPTGEITPAEAVRFLNQATFGASDATTAELVNLASYDAWIDRQIDLPISRTLPYTRANSNGSLRTTRHHIWAENAITGDDQLRQRVAFALSQIFVVSDIDYILSNSQYGMTHYYDTLAEEAFGNFRTLLERVTLHPVMGVYLSMARNEKADPERNVRPDENFAREILQLFTIGLFELTPEGDVKFAGGQPIATYNQQTVEEFAKVFTGWNFADSRSWDSNQTHDRTLPMTAHPEYHDTSSKTLLGGQQLPAGQSAEQDLFAALDNIFNHPNVGPFVSTLLIKRLVTSNPTPGYVGRVASAFNDDGNGGRGNLAAVIKAILLDGEARTGHTTQPSSFGKIKEPIIRLTQLFRAFPAVPGPDADGIYRTSARPFDQLADVFGQSPMRSPSVFNFYDPENPLRPGSDLVSPERQLLSEINLASTNNLFFEQVFDLNNKASDVQGYHTTISIDAELALSEDPEALVAHLDVKLMGGTLPVAFGQALSSYLAGLPATEEGYLDRVLHALVCIVQSPYHFVQK